MGAPTYSDLLERYPRLTSPVDADEEALLDTMLSEAWDDHDEQTWGDARGRGTLLAAAHEWYLHKKPAPQAAAGPLKSKSAGGWAKSFGGSDAATGTDKWWSLSTYGQQHLQLEKAHRGSAWLDGPDW